MLDEAVSRIAHGLVAGGLYVIGARHIGKRDGKIAYGLAQQIGQLGAIAVCRPSIVQGYAGVEEVAGLDRGIGVIIANRLQQGLGPLACDRMLGESRGSEDNARVVKSV